jgi:hypothetical protein
MNAVEAGPVLSPQELLAGSRIVHDVVVPGEVLAPGEVEDAEGGLVRLKPLNVTVLTLVSRASRENPALIPLLMIKESLVEPALTLDQLRQMHIGLIHYLVGKVNLISGLAESGEALNDTAASPLGETHILLAKHFGWTPEQVGQLTPGQVAVYLAGVQKLVSLEEGE